MRPRLHEFTLIAHFLPEIPDVDRDNQLCNLNNTSECKKGLTMYMLIPLSVWSVITQCITVGHSPPHEAVGGFDQPHLCHVESPVIAMLSHTRMGIISI